jgi:hypothetical protein
MAAFLITKEECGVRAEIVVLAAASIAATAASAQERDWEIAPYLWGPAISGEIALGPVARDVDMEFADLLNVLAGAALVHVESTKGNRGLYGDVIWMQLEPEPEIATIGGVAEAELDTITLELGYVQKLARVDLELGVRLWDLELEIDPALLAAIKRDDSWIDGFVGFRYTHRLGTKWRWTANVNVGAGGSDFTSGLQLLFAREFTSGDRFVTGFKMLDIDYEADGVGGLLFRQDLTFAGATIGYVFD